MTTTEKTVSLRELAATELADARRSSEAYEAEEKRKMVEKNRDAVKSLLTKRLLIDPADILFENEGGTATVDGLRFAGWRSYNSYGREETLRLWGECSLCKDQVLSTDIYHLSNLGEQLESFTPDEHDCRGRRIEKGLEQPRKIESEPEPTTEERFISALTDLIKEQISSTEGY